MKEKISLLVLSCDAYEDAWEPCFKLIQKNFKNHPKNCYLMTEEKNYDCKFMDVKTIKAGGGYLGRKG